MADIQSTAGRPFFKPLPEHDTFNTALLLWHMANRVVVAKTGCWEWPVSPDSSKRYGEVGQGRRIYRTHRLVYELCVGSIPVDVGVLHHCDNPPCCNPAHLFLGNQLANMDDCIRKGRFVCNKAHGERNGIAKLDEEKVREIRLAVRREGRSNALARRFAKQFGVSCSTVKGIAAGRGWPHVVV